MDTYLKTLKDLSARIRFTDLKNHGSENLITDIENQFKEIQNSMVLGYEELSLIKTILTDCNTPSHLHGSPQIDALKDAVNNRILDFDQSFSHYRETNRQLLILKGEWLFSQERFEEAVECWEDVLRQEPDHPELHDILNTIVQRYESGGLYDSVSTCCDRQPQKGDQKK